jgi:hypothetical protein
MTRNDISYAGQAEEGIARRRGHRRAAADELTSRLGKALLQSCGATPLLFYMDARQDER